MGRLASVRWNALLPAIAIALGLLSVAVFLRDLGVRGLGDWEVAALLVTGAAFALLMLSRESLARELLWLISMASLAFLILYDLLDALLDPLMQADWPIAAFALILICAWIIVLPAIESYDD